MADETPKIQIDSDWKEEARQEKDRLATEVEQTSPGGAGPSEAPSAGDRGPRAVGPEGLPPASFEEILGTTAAQVFLFLGDLPNPSTGRPEVSLPLAKHYIDLLNVLARKTQGNLEPDEKKHLDQLLYETRMRYVQLASGGAPTSAAAQGKE